MSTMTFEEAFQGSVTVGERGQVVIPAGVRESMGINPGDKLLVFIHPSASGVMFLKLQDLQRMTEFLSPILEAAASATELPTEAQSAEATK